jgi:chromosome segregation ATPase
MSADQPPPPGTPSGDAAPEGDSPSRKWIITTCVLAVVVVGLGIWAFSLNSSNQDKEDTISTQQKQIDEAKGIGGQVKEAVASAGDTIQKSLKDMSAQLDQVAGESQQTQEETQQAIDQAEQAAKQAGNEADKAKAEADETKSCAQGYLSAITGAFDAASLSEGIDQAKTEIEGLNQSCTGILGS